MATPSTIDEYIDGFPPEVAKRLTDLRSIITEHLGGGTETIRYGMPAIMTKPPYGLHFAGWKHHVALYPVPRFDEPLESEIAPYRTNKDTVSFRHDRELPLALVGRVCDAITELRRDA